eukprot:6972967-Prymnesium_polylepis.2
MALWMACGERIGVASKGEATAFLQSGKSPGARAGRSRAAADWTLKSASSIPATASPASILIPVWWPLSALLC